MIEFATVARPYAKALFELAEKYQQAQNWLPVLNQMAWLVQQPKMELFINQTDLDAAQKAASLLNLLDGEDVLDAKLSNFVRIVAEEKRLSVLPEIVKQYQTLMLEKNHAKKAVIYTAYDMVSEGQRAKVISDLEQHLGAGLQAEFRTDSNLIGGLKVVVGDQVLDLSVQGKLAKLYATMTS